MYEKFLCTGKNNFDCDFWANFFSFLIIWYDLQQMPFVELHANTVLLVLYQDIILSIQLC